MASSVDHKSADKPGRDPTAKVRPSTRARPRLEVLETRCLLSGLKPAFDPYPSSVGRHGLARGSYTVVSETKAPHDTLARAQVLPDLSFFGVVGTIRTGDAVDLYRLTLNEKAEELDFGLAFQTNGQVAAIEFQIFDGAGQLLGEWTSGEQGASVVFAQLGPQAAGSTLYLGISAGNQGGAAALSAGVTYQLWVSRESATDQSAGSPQNSSTVPIATLSSTPAGALTPLAAVGTAPGHASFEASAGGPANSPGRVSRVRPGGRAACDTYRQAVGRGIVGRRLRSLDRARLRRRT